MPHARLRLLMLALVVGAIWLLWFTNIPLGVPGEWVWNRFDRNAADAVDTVWGLVTSLLVGAAYTGFVYLGGRRMARASTIRQLLWLAALVAAGFVWLVVVQNSAPREHRLLKQTWVLYDPASSGYFFEAAWKIDDAPSFLAGYELRMNEGDVLHVGTHPPGLFLFHRGLLRLCRSSPGLTSAVLATQPSDVARVFGIVERSTRLSPVPLPRSDRAALWLTSRITQLLAVLTVIPLFRLVRRDYSQTAAWYAACCWPLVPALAVFLPKSDAIYPLLSMLVLDFAHIASRGSKPAAIAAGLTFWIGMLLSLAIVPVAVLAVVSCGLRLRMADREATVENSAARSSNAKKQLAAAVVFAGATVVVLSVVVYLASGMNLFNVWRLNYSNHAGFYEQFSRTWWKWLLINPVELALSAGLPVVLVAVTACVRICKTDLRLRTPAGCNTAAVVFVWLLLHVSGKNMGEAARLWLFVYPWIIWIAPGFAVSGSDAETTTIGQKNFAASPRTWLWLVALMVVECIATVSCVNGFHIQ